MFWFKAFSTYEEFSKAFTRKNSKKNPFCLWHIGIFVFLFMTNRDPLTGPHHYLMFMLFMSVMDF